MFCLTAWHLGTCIKHTRRTRQGDVVFWHLYITFICPLLRTTSYYVFITLCYTPNTTKLRVSSPNWSDLNYACNVGSLHLACHTWISAYSAQTPLMQTFPITTLLPAPISVTSVTTAISSVCLPLGYRSLAPATWTMAISLPSSLCAIGDDGSPPWRLSVASSEGCQPRTPQPQQLMHMSGSHHIVA